MKKPYKVKSQEEGRGKVYTKSFASLEQAQAYIRDRWQGPDYIDGQDGFHSDYSTYELVGFTLNDIGKISWAGEPPYLYREYAFKDFTPAAPAVSADDDAAERDAARYERSLGI